MYKYAHIVATFSLCSTQKSKTQQPQTQQKPNQKAVCVQS